MSFKNICSCFYVISSVLPLVSIYIAKYFVIHCSCRSARSRAQHSTWQKYTTSLWVQMVKDHYYLNDHCMGNYIVINIETIFIWLGVTFFRGLGCFRDGILTILGCPGIGTLNMPWLKESQLPGGWPIKPVVTKNIHVFKLGLL